MDSVRVTCHLSLVTYRAYAINESSPKNVLKTSLRSAIHATDSTCMGCKANSAATNALRHVARVNRRSSRKSSTVLARWNNRFVKCGPAGPGPNNSRSSIKDNHVSGCQLPACSVQKAQTRFDDDRPASTCGLEKK